MVNDSLGAIYRFLEVLMEKYLHVFWYGVRQGRKKSFQNFQLEYFTDLAVYGPDCGGFYQKLINCDISE